MKKKNRKLAVILLTGTLLMGVSACGKEPRVDKNLISNSDDAKRIVNMFTPMEKSNPNAENSARTAQELTVIAAEKALGRLQDAYMRLQALNPAEKSTEMVPDLMAKCYEALDDDLNTPNVISVLFEAVKIINSAADGLVRLDAGDIARLKELFDVMLGEILGIRLESVGSSSDSEAYKGAVDLLMEIRANAKQAKDWTTSDLIRDKLAALGFSVKDTKNGVEWSVK